MHANVGIEAEGACSAYKELQKFADILAPALAMREQRNEHKVMLRPSACPNAF